MPSQSAMLHSPALETSSITRPLANFKPSVWGDRFINYTPADNESERATKESLIEELKQKIRKELASLKGNPLEQLNLIDAIQRLSVAYHFEEEIEEALEHLSTIHLDRCSTLYDVALWFRLLRQHGFRASCDVFDVFKSEAGTFKDSLVNDVRGLLALYEAAHLRVHKEDILDEALDFSRAQLESVVATLSYPLAEQVNHALRQPLHTGMPRLEARCYFPIYRADGSHNTTLLKLAAMDFNLLQELHKEELSDLSRWWKELDFATRLPFARDRLVEVYFWILGDYFEPEYRFARNIFAKVFCMTSILDDMYDAYGTIDELTVFTEAVKRWDISSTNQLPTYMQLVYKELLNVYNEIEEEMAKRGCSYRVRYAKDTMKAQVEGYLKEAKWLHEKYTPTLDEYMDLALLTSGYTMLTIVSYLGMNEIAREQDFDWIVTRPAIIRASESIGRLMDDIRSHKFEQKRGHVSSSVECYMEQYGVTEEEAVGEIGKQIVNDWKEVNAGCLRPTELPMPLIMRILNLTRLIDVIYKDEDGYTLVGKKMRENIASVLIHPVIVV